MMDRKAVNPEDIAAVSSFKSIECQSNPDRSTERTDTLAFCRFMGIINSIRLDPSYYCSESICDRDGRKLYHSLLARWWCKLCRRVVEKCGDDLLSLRGPDLEALSYYLGIEDDVLLERERQEKVCDIMSDEFLPTSTVWTKESIAKTKENFLEKLELVHFVDLACHSLKLNENLIRRWERADPEFCARIQAIQTRTFQRVYLSLFNKAEEGDLGAMLAVTKLVGDRVSLIEPVATEQTSDAMNELANLSPEEQDRLLFLMRKARLGNEGANPENLVLEYTPTNFDDVDDPDVVGVDAGDVLDVDVKAIEVEK